VSREIHRKFQNIVTTTIWPRLLREYKHEWNAVQRSNFRQALANVQAAREALFISFFRNVPREDGDNVGVHLPQWIEYGDLLGEEYCSRCEARTGGDIRFLRLSCFYDLFEADVHGLRESDDRGFTIGICKGCRAEWIQSLATWFNTKRNPDIDSDGIRCVREGTPEYDAFIAAWKRGGASI